VEAIRNEARRHSKVPLKVVEDSYAGCREAYGARLILVRPDQFIAWTGDTTPQGCARVVAQVAGPGLGNAGQTSRNARNGRESWC